MRYVLVFLVLFATNAVAQDAPVIRYQPDPDTPIGTRNPGAPEQSAQFDFVIGDWDVVITWTGPDGETNTYNAKWHNSWIVDGFVVMQEWRGPYASGSEMRQYYAEEGQWMGFNIYAGWGTPKPTTASFIDGEMLVVIEGASDDRGAFLNRETYSNIEADRWRMHSNRSYDNGETWERGAYEMIATRSGS